MLNQYRIEARSEGEGPQGISHHYVFATYFTEGEHGYVFWDRSGMRDMKVGAAPYNSTLFVRLVEEVEATGETAFCGLAGWMAEVKEAMAKEKKVNG